MKVCVVGAGYVGLVLAAVLAHWHHEVVCVEINREKLELIQRGILPVYETGLDEKVEENRQKGRLHFTDNFHRAVHESDVILIAVGTPTSVNGFPDLSALWKVVHDIKQTIVGQRKTIVIKSTIPVGTSRAVFDFLNEGNGQEPQFDVVFTPEFLRQGTALADFMEPERLVIGSRSNQEHQQMAELFAPLTCPVIYTDWQSAEIIKYAANSFLALKISYINTIANFCEETDANIRDVVTGIGLDHRIGTAFLKPGIGFGGSCLPKDTKALVALGEQYGVDAGLFREVLHVNDLQQIRAIRKLKKHLQQSLNGKIIAMLGIAFKANTNDTREAPSLRLIAELLENGCEVHAYDPVADSPLLANHPAFLRMNDAYEAVMGADAVLVVTEWQEFYELDLKRLYDLMKNPLVIDGRNIFSPEEMVSYGFHYVPVGMTVRTPTALING